MANLFSINVLEINGQPRTSIAFAFPSTGVLVKPYVGANASLNSTIVVVATGFAYSVAETVTAVKALANA